MIKTNHITGQCPHCGATAEKLVYHSRYTLKSGQMGMVIRCKQHEGTFCECYSTAFYSLKTPEEKVERAIHQGLEGLCPGGWLALKASIQPLCNGGLSARVIRPKPPTKKSSLRHIPWQQTLM